MNKGNHTAITGGLGNQLFQLARGLATSNGNQVRIDLSLGGPRVNPEGEPELDSYANDLFILENREGNRVMYKRLARLLSKKIFNFALRYGISSKSSSVRMKSIILIELFCSFGSLILAGKWRNYSISRGIGFDPRIKKEGSLLVGYFQTFRWLEKKDVLIQMRSLNLRTIGPDLAQLRELAPRVNPLIVHCRFGDYKSELNFGIPNANYYKKAIDLLFSTQNYSEIWVFSDEIDLAHQQIPNHYLDRVRWIANVDHSSAASLEAMRLGTGYVIANSTFSWWGATLSVNEGCPVVAPKKWFFSGPDPEDLIPDNWIRIDPW
jgi:hypothetical protein